MSGIKTSAFRSKFSMKVSVATILAAAATIAAFPAYAADNTANWNTTTGNWSVAGNWTSPDGATLPPNSATTDANITDANAVVAVDGGFTVGTLTIGTTDVLNLNNNTSLEVSGGSILNNGIISINSSGNATFLYLGATTTLSGTGTLVLSDNSNNYLRAPVAGVTLFNQGNISGAGNIDAGAGAYTLNNSGVISAIGTNALILDPGTVINTHILQAGNGTSTGILNLQNQTYTNTGGSVIANQGSVVNLLSGSNIVGGTLTTHGTGLITSTDGTLSGPVTISTGSTVNLPNNTFLFLTGGSTYTNNGLIAVQAAGNATELIINGNGTTTLAGTGSISLTDSPNNYIRGAGGTVTLVSNIPISGAVNFDTGSGVYTLINHSTLTAIGAHPMDVSPGGGVTNTGILRAGDGTLANAGILNLQNQTYTNTGGSIIANQGSVVNLLSSSIIVGGTLTTNGTGLITSTDGTLSGPITISTGSTVNLPNNTFLFLTGGSTYTNNGSIAVQAAGNATELIINGNGTTTLAGTGSITLTDSPNNYIRGQGGTVTLVSNIPITGAANLDAGSGPYTLINNSTITALGTNSLVLTPGVDVTNNHILQAGDGTNPGNMFFGNGLVYTNTSGSIVANNGSVVSLNSGANIVGGTLTTHGSGLITAINGVFTGPMTISTGSNVNIPNNSQLILAGATTFTNNGVIALQGAGNATFLYINGAGTTTLAGTGSITMTDSPNNYVRALSGTVTLATNIPFTGAANIESGSGAYTLINNSTMTAIGANQMLISPGAGVTNKSILQAGDGTNTGIMTLRGDVFTNTGGSIIANNGSVVNLINSVNIVGGTLTTHGTGIITTDGSTVQFTGPITITAGSTVIDSNNSELQLATGVYTNNGVIEQQSSGNATFLYLNGAVGTVTLAGTGSLTLSNNANNYVRTLVANSTLNNAAGHTIEGSANVDAGTGAYTFTNEGVVNANNSTALNLSPGTSISNTGTFEASNGGTLNVITDLVQDDAATAGVLTAGTCEALAGSAIVISAPAQAITTIGTNATVILSGAGSTITSGGVAIENNLATNNGTLEVLANRNYASGAPVTTFTNNGTTQLGGGTFATPTFANTGLLTGFGTMTPLVASTATGKVEAKGGILVLTAGTTGPSGSTVQIDAGATLDTTGANSTTGTLTQNGSLALGTKNITVSQSYTNANFGVGNSFNKHAGVTPATASGTSGAILASGTPSVAITGSLAFGNVHVNSSNSLNYSITNNATSGPSVLFAIQPQAGGGTISDATLTGAGVTSSNVGPLATNGGTSGPLAVNWNPTVGGPIGGGTAQNVHIANNFDNIAETTLPITGTAFNLAHSNTITPSTITLGNIHAGGTFGTSALSISNTAPAGAFTEGLNATPGTTTVDASVSGSINNLSVAGSPSTAISVGLGNANTNTAGLHTGTVPIAFVSNGTVSTLPNTPLTAQAQTITVNGTVWNEAAAAAIPSINFGSLHVGDPTTTLGVSITNSAPAAFSEKLDASFGTLSNISGPNAFSTNGGSVTLLAAGGANNATSMTVSINPATAGTSHGTVVIHLTSDGQAPGTAGNSGLSTTPLPDQTINLDAVATTVNVFRLAQANTLATPINLGNVRVGGTFGTSALTIQNVATNDGFSEGLDAAVGGTTPDATTNGGSITNLLTSDPANSSAIVVGLGGAANTSTAGAKTGTVAIAFTSDGSTTSHLSSTPLPSQTVTLSGAVYRPASVNTLATPVNLGLTHVGHAFTNAAVAITNTATAADNFSEGLDAAVTGTTPDATSTGSITNLAANTSSGLGNQITVGLGNTSSAGAKTGTVTVGFSTDGATTSGLAPIALTGPTASQIVTVNGQVNEYAHPALTKTSGDGTLTNDGVQAPSYTLNFPTITEPTSGSATLSLENLLKAADPTFQDSLAGTLVVTSGDGTFALSQGLATLTAGTPITITDANAIAPGSSLDNLTASYTGKAAGTYDELLTFTPTSTYLFNGNFIDSSLSAITLDLHLVVNPVTSGVPEPMSLGILAVGSVGLLLRKRRK